METGMTWKLERGRSAQLERQSRLLLASLRALEPMDTGALSRSMGVFVAFLLCELFQGQESTRSYWIDDVVIEAVKLVEGRHIEVIGFAWCGDRTGQWRVPTQLDVRCSEGEPAHLERLTVRIGDAVAATLSAHRSLPLMVPEVWLHELLVLPPEPDPRLDARALEARLDEWLAAHSTRPLLDGNWQPSSAGAVREHIQSRVALGEPVTMEETWLDGGPALRIH